MSESTSVEFVFSNQKIEEIRNSLKKEDLEAIEDSMARMFDSLLYKYRRIFELGGVHCEEKAGDDNVPHLFGITFSDLEIYLNPEHMKWNDRDNIGCIRYMFNHKSDNHRYCIFPTSTWKLVDHIFEKYSDFKSFIDDPQINEFHKCVSKHVNKETGEITETGKIDFNKLVHCYYKAGCLQGIIDKALNCNPDSQLELSLKTIKDMLDKDKGVITPIERFTDKRIPIKYDKLRYKEALENLNIYNKPKNSIDNQLRSLNLAIACYLTGKPLLINMSADRAIPVRQPVYVRLISNARSSVNAFRRIKIKDTVTGTSEYLNQPTESCELIKTKDSDTDISEGKYVSCCPQFLVTLILLKRKLVQKVSTHELDERKNYFNKAQSCLEKLRSNCLRMAKSMRFTTTEYHLDDEGLVKDSLLDVYDYLLDLIEFRYNIFPLINSVMKINLCYEDFHNESQNWSHAPLKTLNDFRERPLYEEVMAIVCSDTYNDARMAYRKLYKYAKRKGILERDSALSKMANELEKVYNGKYRPPEYT